MTAHQLSDRITRAQTANKDLLAELLLEQERLIILAARRPSTEANQ